MLEAHFAPKPPVKVGQPYSHGSKSLIECRSLGVTAYTATPVLSLCRKLEALAHGDDALTVYRGDTPVMFVSSIRGAAKLTVKEDGSHGPRFAPYIAPSINAKAPGFAPMSALADAE